jgi:tetratricopeptide (TPR) repeat protein
MRFFSSLTLPWNNPQRTGQRSFERGRAAELRGDFAAAEAYFRQGAQAYDAHLAHAEQAGREVRPSDLTRAGICYVRVGRDDDGLRVLEQALARKDIPDAFLHAGYAAARLGDRDGAARHWSRYPDWAGQPIIAAELRERLRELARGADLGSEPGADLDAACEAVARAVLRQDRENARARPSIRHSRPVPPHRGY